MGKKCIPGIICIENMTLFILILVLFISCYIFYAQFVKNTGAGNNNTFVILPSSGSALAGTSLATMPLATMPLANMQDSRNAPLTDLYAPPLKDGMFFRKDSGDVRGIPVNVKTRSVNDSYQQMGILTRNKGELILPMMGRQLTTGNYKWQYYAVSGNGFLNTKLPISLSGKSCTSEYGCDSINNGDNVYVEGYNDTFKVTLYENSTFNYIPFL